MRIEDRLNGGYDNSVLDTICFAGAVGVVGIEVDSPVDFGVERKFFGGKKDISESPAQIRVADESPAGVVALNESGGIFASGEHFPSQYVDHKAVLQYPAQVYPGGHTCIPGDVGGTGIELHVSAAFYFFEAKQPRDGVGAFRQYLSRQPVQNAHQQEKKAPLLHGINLTHFFKYFLSFPGCACAVFFQFCRMKTIDEKYAALLVQYCLAVQPGDRVYVVSSYLAESLLREVVRQIYTAGGFPVLDVELNGFSDLAYRYASDDILGQVNPLRRMAMESFEGYLNIRAPFSPGDEDKVPADNGRYAKVQAANRPLNQLYFSRIADGSMRRCLCQYPTPAGAQTAGMSLAEYEQFVYGACKLNDEDPAAEWLKLREVQQVYVDYLNQADRIHYRGPNIDITFSVKGRKWMNSDGRSNMPSGEVFSAPVEDSVNGKVRFSYPCVYMGQDVEDVELTVENGYITHWDARKGKGVLDKVFSVDGARWFGEVAVGTNYDIQRITRNILFDEKIGGSIHMAVGQSYKQCGGRNESTVHWDMITDMRDGGEIIADGEVIYRNGKFLIG